MFLTLEDPNARIQGSRDPLGVQPVWTAFGRHLVTNITTVTTSIRGFTVLILGRLFAEKMIEKGVVGEQDALPVFLRAEQIGSYARYVGHGVTDEIRGIERVARFAEEGGGAVNIQDDASGLILSDQRVYGLWGLYSASARVSGLIAEGPVGLTECARTFAHTHYWPAFEPVESKLFRLLKNGGRLKTSKKDPIFRATAAVLPVSFTGAEIDFYRETLRDAAYVRDNPAARRQLAFVQLMLKHADLDTSTGRQEVMTLARKARAVDKVIAGRLDKIARVEALFAPAEAVFNYLQARSRQKIADVARVLRDSWGRGVPHLSETAIDENLPEIASVVGEEIAETMKRCDRALGAGEYAEAIRRLLDWNALVMAARKAAPWIREKAGKLDVRYRGLERELPDGDAVPLLWRNPYFIDALKAVTRSLEEDR